MNDKVLLIGNGINNIKQNYRWVDLINNLINYIGASGQIRVEDKPFPMLYEEIFVEAVKNRKFKESNIKNFIAREVTNLEPNDIHEQILETGIGNILTTNYDLTLEKKYTQTPETLKNNGAVKESTFSLFRHYSINKTAFWHIHGDANIPGSITLGYEHYSGYLQQMRNYVANGTGTAYKIRFEPLIRRLKNKSFTPSSWVDFFFTKDVYIIGLTLDFIEIHLWWLLTFRQRLKLIKQAPITNNIIYFYPDVLAKTIQNKLDLFRSIGVTPFSVSYQENNKGRYYQSVLKKIKSNLK
ncbi:MAG TPA: SIR2 family protein [Cyclobacteriaceae bacterium]|nr:SIR2 family protein [Cyclobacteriaceae bacterium]